MTNTIRVEIKGEQRERYNASVNTYKNGVHYSSYNVNGKDYNEVIEKVTEKANRYRNATVEVVTI